jgi:hypothetical protein
MDTRKTTNTAPAGPAPAGATPAPGQASTRKLVRQRLAPEMDRYLLRLGLTGLLDGGAPK